MNRRRLHIALLAAVAGLLVLAALYQIKGNLGLIVGGGPGDAVDLRGRELEHAFFVNGANPFDHMTASQPPWGYPFGLLLTWPAWPYTRVYFAVLNAIALGFLMWWAYQQAAGESRSRRWLLAASVAAFGGSCTATQVGQVGIIVTALLAGALWCEQTGRHYRSGLLVGLALIKPTIAAPFAAALLIGGRYRAAASVAAYAAAASGVTWAVTGASPIHMMLQLAASAASYLDEGTLGLVDLLAAWGVMSSTQVALTPILVAVPALIMMAIWRHSLVLLFAVAAVSGRLWTYHKFYDDVMLVFLLVPLGVIAFRTRARPAPAIVAFILVGAVSWIPGRLLAEPLVQMLQLVVWPSALIYLLVASRQRVGAVQPAPAPALEHVHAS